MLHPRAGLVIATLAVILAARAAGAADIEGKRFYVTPMVGWTFLDDDRLFRSGQKLNDDVYFGGRLGARLSNRLGFELAGGWTGTKDCASCTESWAHYSGNLMLSPAPSHVLNPFLSLGAGWSRAQHTDGSTNDAATFEAAIGARVQMNETFGLRLEARNVLARAQAGWAKSHLDDVVLGAGLTIGFGGHSDEYVPAPRTAAVVAVDGDADRDGVADSRDQCPDTPKGLKVDKNGCPFAIDAKVLEKELLDTGRIAISNVNFDYDKSEIRPDAHAALDSVGKVLTKWEGLRIQIDAYTDSRGTEAYNMELSHRRAESVRAYLLARFPQFEPTQLTARSYGEADPVVPNSTAANMELNRRVEFQVLNKEVLERRK